MWYEGLQLNSACIMAQAYGVWVNIGHSGGVNVSANKEGSISVACVWQPLVHGWFKRNTNAVMLSLWRLVGYAIVVLIMMVGVYWDDVNTTKAKALRLRICLTSEIDLSPLIVESDLLLVI